MDSLRDQVAVAFAAMDRPAAWGPVGTIPSEDEFSEVVGGILRNLDAVGGNPVRFGEVRTAYLSGYIDCSCQTLAGLGWDVPLVATVSVLLSLAYLDRYLVYEIDSWRRTFSKTLHRYFSEDFTERFLDDALGRVHVNA